MIVRSAADRVFRTLVFSVGAGGLVFTLLGLPAIVQQYSYVNPVYTIIAIIVFCGLPPTLAVLAFRAPVPVLRTFALIHCVVSMALLLLWVPSMLSDSLPGQSIPWLINMITVGTCMAAIALPFVGAWIYLFAIATVSGLVRYAAYGGGDTSIAFQDSVMIVLISGFMMALLQLTLQAGREQDAAARIAQDAATANAAAENLERQRTRYHAFTHDDVLATLLAASQDGARPSEITRRSAQRTLEKMDQFRDDLPVPPTLTMTEFEAHLRHSAAAVGVPLVSTLTATEATDLTIPTEIADALSEALTEAMRNSVRHSGWPDEREVHREARASRTPEGVELLVTDDGKGFSPARIGLDRLGVRLSILQRVNSQPGGEATITSSRGAGATVRLFWNGAGVSQ